MSTIITKQEILNAQQEWASSIVEVGKLYIDGDDYKSRAVKLITELYAYDMGTVLFKPTLASEKQFRNNFDDALSYFIGGQIPEDHGFAIKPWSKVEFDKQEIIIMPNYALAMGNYYFTSHANNEITKVEYTFGYLKDKDNNLRINLHHSSLPFNL